MRECYTVRQSGEGWISFFFQYDHLFFNEHMSVVWKNNLVNLVSIFLKSYVNLRRRK